MLKSERNQRNYDQVIETALPRIKRMGYENVKAALAEYEEPGEFRLQGSEELVYQPDLTATKNDAIGYFEIAIKSADPQRLISKWRLLDTIAKRKLGTFYIIQTKGTYRFTEDVVKEHKLEAKLIRLD